MMKSIAAASFTLCLYACGQERPKDWIHPAWADLIEFKPSEQTGVSLWRSDHSQLRLKSDTAIKDLAGRIKNQYLVMVKFDPDSPFAQSLRTSPRTLGVFTQSGENLALVAVANDQEGDALALAAHNASHSCGSVMPVALTALPTPDTEITAAIHPETAALPSVPALLQLVSQDQISATIANLERLGTRFHTSDSGKNAAASLRQIIQQVGNIEAQGASIAEFDHSTTTLTRTTPQKSLIVTIPGSRDDETTVIIGAHLDSINRAGSVTTPNLSAPGADDDASGLATLVEVIRVISASGVKFARRIELHAYAAEEISMIGSRHIANTYRAEQRKVAAMMQLDMNSWARDPNQQTIYLVSNETHKNLRRSLKDLLHSYLGGNFVEKRLTAGSSDHRSWYEEGFATVFPFEDPNDFNQALHTEQDTLQTINNLALNKRVAQMVLAFLAHYAGIEDAQATTAKQNMRNTLGMDLKLAILPSRLNAEQYAVHVGTSNPEIKSVDFCHIGEAASTACRRERLSTVEASDESSRHFFSATQSLELSADDRLAIFGFDVQDKLIAYRTIRLAAKNDTP